MAVNIDYKIERKVNNGAWSVLTTVPSSLVPLYYEGNEPQPSLAFEQGSVNTGASTNKNNNTLTCQASRASNQSQGSMVSSIAFNLTGISTIIVDWQNSGTGNNNNKSGIAATTSKTHDPWSTSAAHLSKQNSFSRRDEELDVSGLTGNHFIQIYARDNDTGKTARTSTLNVYSIILKEG